MFPPEKDSFIDGILIRNPGTSRDKIQDGLRIRDST